MRRPAVCILKCLPGLLCAMLGSMAAAQCPPYFTSGSVYLFSSSHQDIAWMDSVERCIEQRDRAVISPALETMKHNSDYKLAVEDSLCLEEYLDRHPERYQEVLQRVKEGRLEWGATYNQTYESLQSGEALVRQTYYGRKWLKHTLPGCDTDTAWSPDVPGRAMQMPQILRKSGVKYLIFSRHGAGFYRWQSPDGSEILTWTPGSYVGHHEALGGDEKGASTAAFAIMGQAEPYYKNGHLPPIAPIFVSTDALGPVELRGLFASWNRLRERGTQLPNLIYSTGSQFMQAIAKQSSGAPVIVGERPNVWLYIHGPTHHHAISAKREADRLLPAAEVFSTIAALRSGDMKTYPQDELTTAWKAAIYADHGWGGNYGELTDQRFEEKAVFARDTARTLLTRALDTIAGSVESHSATSYPIVVFNSLSWKRTDPVTYEMTFEPGKVTHIIVKDTDGHAVPEQELSRTTHPDGSIKSVKFVFIASDVPSFGYSTYLVQPVSAPAKVETTHTASESQIENQFYRIQLGAGGIHQIHDKELAVDILHKEKFLGGELFTLHSEGNGAGEFAEVQQPTMQEFDRLSNYKPQWKQIEDGPVRTVYQLEVKQSDQKIRHCSVRQRLLVYHDIKKLDLETEILGWDGTPWREFRLAFPVDVPNAQVSYEVPMGIVRVGKDEIAGAAGERYVQPCAQVHPREVQNWIDATGTTFGVTLATSVAVFDWQDPTRPTSSTLLQPILLASRKSCHPVGNYYLQAGNHSYTFSLLSHKSGGEQGRQYGVQANMPLIAVAPPSTKAAGSHPLPSRQSFCSIEPASAVITTIKKCEDNDSIILRCCEVEGRTAPAHIRFYRDTQNRQKTNLIEEDGQPLSGTGSSIEFDLAHHGIETLQFVTAPSNQ